MRSSSLRTTLLVGTLLAGTATAAPLAAQTTTPPSHPPAAGQPGARDGQGPHGQRGPGRGMRSGRPGRGSPRGGQHALRATLRGVTLSEAQRTQLRTIAERYRIERQGWRAEARRQWEAQRGHASAQPGAAPDSAARAARLAFRTQQAERMRTSMERELADVRGILTAEQRPTFDRNVSELRSRMQERQQARREGRGWRGGPGAPGRAGR